MLFIASLAAPPLLFSLCFFFFLVKFANVFSWQLLFERWREHAQYLLGSFSRLVLRKLFSKLC